MLKIRFLALFLALPLLSVHGQTRDELEKRYGPPIKEIMVRRGVVLTAKYAADGRACEMVLENRHSSDAGVDTNNALSDDLVRELIDELVPSPYRGTPGQSHGWSINLGQIIQTNYDFENVQITSTGTRASRNIVVKIRWKNRKCQ